MLDPNSVSSQPESPPTEELGSFATCLERSREKVEDEDLIDCIDRSLAACKVS